MASRPFCEGEVITWTKTLHFNKTSTIISPDLVYESSNPSNESLEDFSARFAKQQLAINYGFSHPDSDLLLVPLSNVLFINHAKENFNAAVEFALLDNYTKHFVGLPTSDLLKQDTSKISLLYRATRDIREGEEVSF